MFLFWSPSSTSGSRSAIDKMHSKISPGVASGNGSPDTDPFMGVGCTSSKRGCTYSKSLEQGTYTDTKYGTTPI